MKVCPRFLSCLVWTALAVGPAAGQDKQAPFEIPPEGKPEVLVGGIKFEGPSALAFDSLNRPYMFHSREPESFGYILTLRGRKWVRLSYVEALRKTFPQLRSPGRRSVHALGTIAIDNADGLYAIVHIRKSAKQSGWCLLYSPDLGGRFEIHELPGAAYLETRVGHNNTDHPPAIGCIVFRKAHPARWTAYHNLSVFLPVKKEGRLVLGKPIHVSSDCFGVSNHSGGYSFAVTTGPKTHLAYAEIPKTPNGGNPTYAATIDRKERKVTARQFLVTAPPKTPDVHSTPVIAVDANRHLHVVAGAHGQPFLYIRSRMPDSIAGGWTKPAPMGGRQTYATLVCNGKNRLHSIYRVHPQLLYQHKPAAADAWSQPAVLAHPPKGHRGYSIFYHRLFVDRAGALYVSFTFYETRTTEKGRYPRALAISEDNGKSWRLTTTATFLRRSRR